MSNRNREAGKSTYEMARKRRKAMIIIAVVGVIIFVILLLTLNNTKALGIGGIGFLGLLFLVQAFPDFLDGILGKKQKEVKRAIRGADAEVKIDQLLGDLSEDYLVLNDLASPYGNIDHVVFSKDSGIFLIETKSHRGKVSVRDNVLYLNEQLPEKDFIKQTLKNTYWLREKLIEIVGVKVWINPVIVFTNAFVPFIGPVKGIRIVNKKFLLSTIMNSKHTPDNQALWEQRENILSKLD